MLMYRLNCYCQLVQRNLSPKVLDLTVVTTYLFAVHKDGSLEKMTNFLMRWTSDLNVARDWNMSLML